MVFVLLGFKNKFNICINSIVVHNWITVVLFQIRKV